MSHQSEDQILLIRNMHWGTTIGGAFQRSYVYKKNINDNLKQNFRKSLRLELEAIELDYFDVQIEHKAHIKNIIRLQKWSEQFKDMLTKGKLNFGISQKLLNLHIKGVWCFGFINYPPPHFPVDRIIQERLRMKPIIPWTKIEDEKEYTEIIDKAIIIAKKHNVNLAELELKVYNNTLKIEK
jgi:hypothetical protein